MAETLPTIFITGIFLIAWIVLYAHQRKEKKKRMLPLLGDFLSSHGMITPVCHACGKDQLKDEGLGSGDDSRRYVSCQACGTLLYRYDRPHEAQTAS